MSAEKSCWSTKIPALTSKDPRSLQTLSLVSQKDAWLFATGIFSDVFDPGHNDLGKLVMESMNTLIRDPHKKCPMISVKASTPITDGGCFSCVVASLMPSSLNGPAFQWKMPSEMPKGSLFVAPILHETSANFLSNIFY